MKHLRLIVAFSMLSIIVNINLFSTPAAAVESDVYFSAESFTWKEFSNNGAQILKESGPIFALGASMISSNMKGLIFEGKAEVFGGVVDYDGQTLAGSSCDTNVDYYGSKLEGGLGWKFMVGQKVSVGPIGGLGVRIWSRNINSTSNAFGYDELWSSFYGILGLRGDILVSGTMKVFAEGGAKLPIYNQNRINFLDVTLEPGNEVSPYGELGLKWKRLKVSVFYEGMRFSKSDPQLGGAWFILYQPESKADIYGVSVGLVF